MFAAIAFLAVASLFLWIIGSWFRLLLARNNKLLPSGPFPLPILGNALSLDTKSPHLTFEKWAIKYGNLFSVMMGNQVAIVIADVDLLRKAFKDERFSGRPNNYFFDLWKKIGFPLGFAEAEGEIWKEHRRFSLQALRDFGFGRPTGEDYIQKEANDMVKTLSNSNGEPINNHVVFATAACNVTAFMLFGNRFGETDPRFLRYIESESENFKDFANASLVDMFPYLAYVPPLRGKMKESRLRVEEQVELLNDLISEHEHSFDPQNPRDYIDAFLVEKQKGQSSTFTDGQLMSNVVDIFAASFETTTTFLRWGMLYMIHFPEVQHKVQQEIEAVLGSAPVKFADRTRLPYTEAAILEIFRFANYIPFFLPHKAMEEVEFEGFRIPKDTTVLGLSWFINRDRSLWKDPEVFRPERFLDTNGQIDQTIAVNVLAFSTGKRACPGEPLARMEVLVFFGTILQKFTIKAGNEEKPPLDKENGLTLTPKDYLMRALRRG